MKGQCDSASIGSVTTQHAQVARGPSPYLLNSHVQHRPVARLVCLEESVNALQATAACYMLNLTEAKLLDHMVLLAIEP